MKKRLLSVALFTASLVAMAQVGVGTTTPQAALDVVSSNSGFLFPRVANAAAVSSPKNGMIVYDLSLNCFNFYENNAWTGCLDPNVASNGVLAQIGREADDPDAINSVVTLAQFECIVPIIRGLNAGYETAYQDYIDANPALFASPATQAEVQAMIDAVNSSATVLAQIGNEADAPDAINSVVTLAQFECIVPTLTGVFADKEVSYQNYIDAHPALFSSPATQAEVQAMLNAITATDVVGPNGKIWMDRNLGASQVATSSTDTDAYGDLYQWGRGRDGHQARNSSTRSTQATTDTPGHGDFILGSSDWRTTSNNNLWQGANGTNNPCPTGYRIPTEAEWNGLGITNAATAFSSPLKLPLTGYRNYNNGSLYTVGVESRLWSSTVSGSLSGRLDISSSSANFVSTSRATGFAVRCIQD